MMHIMQISASRFLIELKKTKLKSNMGQEKTSRFVLSFYQYFQC